MQQVLTPPHVCADTTLCVWCRDVDARYAPEDLSAPGPYLHPRDWWSTHLMTRVRLLTKLNNTCQDITYSLKRGVTDASEVSLGANSWNLHRVA